MKSLLLITHPNVIQKHWDILSSSENKLEYLVKVEWS